MATISSYSFSLHLASTLLTLTLATAIPFPPPAPSLPINQPVPPLSLWSAPSNASFQNTEQEFQQIRGFSPPTCDAPAYGQALRLESCREAQRMIPMDRGRLVFGVRNRGRWAVNLPYRWSSSDGLCVIEVGLPAFGVSDEASAFDIAHAAWMIINTCVADFQHEGGRMDGVGLHKRLPVHVASYDPHVRCSPPASPPAPNFYDCDALIKQMRSSKQLYDFGPQGWPHLDFVVPYMFSSPLPRRGCVLSVRLEPGVDKTVTASWYDIWAAAIAVQQICVARGRSGATVDVGWPTNLIVQMMADPRPRTPQVGAGADDTTS